MEIREVEEFLAAFVTLAQARKLLSGVSRQRILEHVSAGRLACVQSPYGRVYRRSDLETIAREVAEWKRRMRETAANATEKRCRRCGETKPLSEFSASSKKLDGAHSYCKPCVARAARAYNRTPEAREKREAWYRANRDRVREYGRAYQRRRRAEMKAGADA